MNMNYPLNNPDPRPHYITADGQDHRRITECYAHYNTKQKQSIDRYDLVPMLILTDEEYRVLAQAGQIGRALQEAGITKE